MANNETCYNSTVIVDIQDQSSPRHLTAEELSLGLAEVCAAPRNDGVLELIVARPQNDQRLVLDRVELSPEDGLSGDRWRRASWLKLPDDAPDPAVQITIMNARCTRLVAGKPEF